MWQNIKNIYHLVEAVLANIQYGFPGKEIKVIGVTGTDGKTTTSHLIYHILKENGVKVSISSSIFADVAGEITDTGLHVTTQSRWKIQSNLRKAVKKGYTHFVLETTSHGIHQYRNWGIPYEVGVLTNVSEEHLDYHGIYERYLATKAKLLTSSRFAVFNRDDRSYKMVKDIVKSSGVSYKTYALKNNADLKWSDLKMKSPLDGEFNKENILAAYLACKRVGLSDTQIKKAVTSFKLPHGRFDTVYDENYKVVIDFAHTPNSIRKLLASLKKNAKGKIIHVFGSAGLRDYIKRPDMGKASAEFADYSIVTEEDYRIEKLKDINKKVIEGFESVKKEGYEVIEDRQEAISKAIKLASKGDVVVITGKGHEKSLSRGKKEYDWDEYLAVKKAIKGK